MNKRNLVLQNIDNCTFDLVVIGAGIVGAGIALDASSRGFKVLLIDKNDFGSGTSSKTTKLIHGGLRYLEQFEFKLCNELSKERELLLNLNPNMIKEQSFLIPLKKNNHVFNSKIKIGLTIYDLISGHWNKRHKKISAIDFNNIAPEFNNENIDSAVRYFDCISDDTRLVLDVVKTAINFGCVAINYCEFISSQTLDDLSHVVKMRCRIYGENYDIKASHIINATGVWSDNTIKQIDANWSNKVIPAKGTHIVLSNSTLDIKSALLLPSSDGRFIFVLPWQKSIVVGTTDLKYDGDIDNPIGSIDEVIFLLNELNAYLVNKKIELTDIKAIWSGLRPLVDSVSHNDKVSSTKSISRKHIILDTPGNTITVIGGKLTNYRIIAKEVVDLLVLRNTNVELKSKECFTQDIYLGGFSDKADLLSSTAAISARGRKLMLDPATIDHLLATYGKEAQNILNIIEENPQYNQRIIPDFPVIFAEIPYNIKYEMAVSLQDIMYRRTRLAMINQVQCYECCDKVAKIMQNILGWDDNRFNIEIKAFQKSLSENMQPVINNLNISMIDGVVNY